MCSSGSVLQPIKASLFHLAFVAFRFLSSASALNTHLPSRGTLVSPSYFGALLYEFAPVPLFHLKRGGSGRPLFGSAIREFDCLLKVSFQELPNLFGRHEAFASTIHCLGLKVCQISVKAQSTAPAPVLICYSHGLDSRATLQTLSRRNAGPSRLVHSSGHGHEV